MHCFSLTQKHNLTPARDFNFKQVIQLPQAIIKGPSAKTKKMYVMICPWHSDFSEFTQTGFLFQKHGSMFLCDLGAQICPTFIIIAYDFNLKRE